MSLSKNDKKLTFYIEIHTTKGILFAVKINKRLEVAALVKEEAKPSKKLTAVEAHRKLGHLSIQSTKDTAKTLGWHLQGDFDK